MGIPVLIARVDSEKNGNWKHGMTGGDRGEIGLFDCDVMV